MIISKYFKDGEKEVFIPYAKDDKSGNVAREVKAYCFHFGVTAKTETIYGANPSGEGFRFLHVILDKEIERKKNGRKPIRTVAQSES